MKIKKEIEFLTAGDVLAGYEVDGDLKNALHSVCNGEDFDPLVFKQLEVYDLYYCQQHNIFHEYYYETDDGNIYTTAEHHPVCPLCLLGVEITG